MRKDPGNLLLIIFGCVCIIVWYFFTQMDTESSQRFVKDQSNCDVVNDPHGFPGLDCSTG